MSKRRHVQYAVTDGRGGWIMGFEYPPKGEGSKYEDSVQLAAGAWALMGQEPFQYPSAGPFTWPNGDSAANVAHALGYVVALAPPAPERPLELGDSVTQRGNAREVGVVKEFIEPEPGWRRARVLWPDRTEQYVDLDRLQRHEGEHGRG